MAVGHPYDELPEDAMTPRNQAVLATVAGVAVGGLIVAGVAALVGGDRHEAGGTPSTTVSSETPASVTPTVPAPDPTAGPLDPPAIKFVTKTFGTKTAHIKLDVPDGWKYTRQDEYNAWFTGPHGIWRLRVDATANSHSIDQQLVLRERSLHKSTPSVKVFGREHGSQEVSWGPGMITYRTLIYSYTNKDKGLRFVMNRFIALGDSGRTAIEITTSGRPEDQAGLDAVLAQATATLVLQG
ncbi:MAG TPA: hypothetical protein VEK80_15165 [Kribbellaceae bacterium]|nr:hypothetical protein [Kribbellaceae bacterium]